MANGVAVSVRCDGDIPDLCFKAALAVSTLFGTAVSPAMHFVDNLNKKLKRVISTSDFDYI